MYIEGRGRNEVLLCAIWFIVPVTTLLLQTEFDAFLAIMVICGAVFHVFGVLAYLGFYEGFAGFNTATDEELSHYDMNKMTAFMGVSFCIAGCMFSILTIILREYSGVLMAIFVGIIFLLVALISVSIYMSVSKRFKAVQ